MSVPDFLPQPETPPAWSPYVGGVKVIGQLPQSDGTILVTFGLAGASPVTVRVPQSVWLSGDHLAVGYFLAKFVFTPAVQPQANTGAGGANDSDKPS